MPSKEELARMDPHERAELMRVLAELASEDPFADRRLRVRRRFGITFLTASCLILIPWIVLLAGTLPAHYRAGQWGLAWTGFDVALLLALAGTAAANLLRRQVMVAFMLITATLLCCDAWFDVMLSWGSSEAPLSVATALLVELPTAALMLAGVRKVADHTISVLMHRGSRRTPAVIVANPAHRRHRRAPAGADDRPPGAATAGEMAAAQHRGRGY